MEFIRQNPEIAMLAAGWLFDNILAHCPSVKSNSTFQLVCNLIDKAVAAAKK
jgi:hypothetical protein